MNALKKPLQRVLIVLIALVAGGLLSSALFAITGFSLFGGPPDESALDSNPSNSELIQIAYEIVEHIGDYDYDALSKYVHPEYGVVFSPCATITLSTNRRFTEEQVAAFSTDRTPYVWGVRDGSGEPIERTPSEYFSEFVNFKDFSAAPVVGINHIVRNGNALENITDIFSDVQFVDFHFPNDDRNSASEHNWATLRLGFEAYNDLMRLTVVLRSVWTE